MGSMWNYLWIILLAIYIISPIDGHPLFVDDLFAAGVLLYYLYKNAKEKKQQQYNRYGNGSSGQSRQSSHAGPGGPLTLDKAYRELGVTPSASWEEIGKAYREKMTKSHPDKVSHLSEELQEKAKELTLKLNEAFDLIKRHRRQ
ncbi:MAG: DnaJ domain-containing protein [Nitrospiraceae bacterium]|nr:MAG: DnaJ domain-containing protein [Nitrospiraceae bacterium]